MKPINLRFLFIRHAQSIKNTDPTRIAGRSEDTPLSEIGKNQAQLLGNRLKTDQIIPDAIFASPLPRALDTAKISLHEAGINTPIQLVEDLQEFTQGDWEGELRNDIYQPETLAKINTAGYLFTPPNGESQRMVERRVSNWLEDTILYNPDFHGEEEKTILIYSHGIAIKCLLHYILRFSDRYIYRFELNNTGICEFRFTEQGWFPTAINDHSHLK